MSKIKLDLSEFKHIKSDKSTTTLQHKNGHTLTLSHKSLSPEAQAQLSALTNIGRDARTPLEQDAARHGGYAKGGPVYKNPELAKKGMDSIKERYDSPEAQQGRKKSEEVFRRADHELKKVGHPGPVKIEMAEGGNAAEKRKEIFGSSSAPHNKEGGEVKEETLDYNKIRREKRDMNNKENNQPIKPKKYADGGLANTGNRVPAPSGGADDGSVDKQAYAHSIAEGSQSGGPSLSDGIANARKEIGSLFGYADGGPIRQQYAEGDLDIGGVQDTLQGKFNPDTPTAPVPQEEQYDASGRPLSAVQPSDDGHEPAISPVVDVLKRMVSDPSDKGEARYDRFGKEIPKPSPLQPPDAQPMEQGQDTSRELADTADMPAIDDNSAMANRVHQPDTYGSPTLDNRQAAPQQMQAAPAGPATMAEHYQNDMNKLTAHDQAFLNDYQAGHIQPKTIADLYANKSTPGKVGTILGMLIGGFGAGLSKQPNLLVEQMNKEINNDIDAQKTSASNAQNFLRINQEGLAREANIEDTAQSIKERAQALTWAQMAYHTMDSFTHQIEAMPDGPQKQQAQQTLSLMSQGIQNEKFSMFSRAAAASAQAKMFFGQSQSGNPESAEATFQQHMNGLKMLGPNGEARAKDLESKHLPGIPGQASIPIPQETRDKVTAMNVLDAKAKDMLNFARANKGNYTPATLKVGAQKAAEMVNFYNNSIQGGVLTAGRLKWLDDQIAKNPASIFQDVLGNNRQLEEIASSNVMRRNELLKSVGLGSPQGQAQQAQPQIKVVGGKKYMRGPNGEAIPVK